MHGLVDGEPTSLPRPRADAPIMGAGSGAATDLPEATPFEYRDGAPLYHLHYVLPSIAALLGRGPGSALDAGCGNGALAAWLADRGWRVTAVDIAADGIAVAQRSYPGPRFVTRSVHEPMGDLMPVGGWDAVVSSEVIEHLYAPRRFLQNMFSCLRPGGTLVVTTPYHGYLKNLAIGLAGTSDQHFHPGNEGGHIKFFSQATLAALLVEVGFRDCHFRNAGRLPWLWKSIVCRARRPEVACRPQ